MAGEWKLAPAEVFCASVRDGTHDSPKPVECGRRLVTSRHITAGRLDIDSAYLISEEEFDAINKRSKVCKWDVLISMIGTVGEPCLIKEEPDFAIKNIGLFKSKGETEGKWLYYYLRSPEAQQAIREQARGTTQQYIPLGALRAFPIPVPSDWYEMRAITHILGTLDDKIELNRRMSETLEAMARALFKSWFVDFDPVRAKMEGRWQRGQSLPGLPTHLYDLFPDRLVDSELGEIPEGWKIGPLGQFFEIGLGGAWGEDQPSVKTTVSMHCLRGIDCHDLAEGRIPDVPLRWVTPKQVADRELPEGAILIEGSGSFCGRSVIWDRGYEWLIGGPVGYSNFCKRLDPRCDPAQAVVCWMQMRQAYRDETLQSFRTGTAFPNFDVHGALSNLIVVVPPVPLAQAFVEAFALSRRLNLMAQSRALAAIRDTLLPTLISGELRVKDASRFVREPVPC